MAIFTLPFFFLLWEIDEIFYGGYRKVNVDDVVWIVSSPRTGSTNLIDALLKDERDFVSPSHVEAIVPFICVNRVIDLLMYVFGLLGVDLKDWLTGLAKSRMSMNDDAIDHHPMELFGFVLGEGEGGEKREKKGEKKEKKKKKREKKRKKEMRKKRK